MAKKTTVNAPQKEGPPTRRAAPKRKTKLLATSERYLADVEKAWKEIRKETLPQDPTTAPPGIYEDTSYEWYDRIDAINQSRLKLLWKSPMHYRYQPPSKETPALFLGSLIHTGALEPNQLLHRYAILPEFEKNVRTADGKIPANPRSTKQYKEAVENFKTTVSPKEVITREQFNNLAGMVTAIHKHPIAKRLLTKGKPEVVLVWRDEITQLLCKCRIDFLSRENAAIVDIKTTEDIERWDVSTYGYDIQNAHYSLGARCHGLSLDFHFVVVEKRPPFGVMVGSLGQTDLLSSIGDVREMLNTVRYCTDKKRWPGIDTPQTFWQPAWRKSFRPARWGIPSPLSTENSDV